MPLSRLLPVEPPPHEVSAATETMQVASARARSPMRDPARNILRISSRIITPPGRSEALGFPLSVSMADVSHVPVANDDVKHEEQRRRRIVGQPADAVNP